MHRRARHEPARRRASPAKTTRYDFGSGAGFYVDATETPWAAHYRMYSYVTDELPALIDAQLPDRARPAGHLRPFNGRPRRVDLRLQEPGQATGRCRPSRRSASPTPLPWGEKAFGGYLGADRDAWRAYDASLLATRTEWRSEVLVDQGSADDFLSEQLKPQLLQEACAAAGIPLTLRYAGGLRPQLLLHRQLHRRACCPPCPGPDGIGPRHPMMPGVRPAGSF